MNPLDLPTLRFGAWLPRFAARSGLGVVIDGLVHDHGEATPADYAGAVLLAPEHREAFFGLIDQVGLVICKRVGGDDATHAEVRGRSSRGRLSQGENYHHDGCSGPDKPRVVEIRCPYQALDRHTATAVAPFPDTVHAMLRELPAGLRGADPAVAAWYDLLGAEGALPAADYDLAQGAVNRVIRHAMDAESARAFFRAVDVRAGAHREPWEMGESRFIANANPGRTMQHRRAYLEPPGRPNGRLVKRWPAGPEMHD